jgi:enoyl-CoA hydratase/carnithine racemase
MMDAAEAERAGLVSRVVPAAELMDVALAAAADHLRVQRAERDDGQGVREPRVRRGAPMASVRAAPVPFAVRDRGPEGGDGQTTCAWQIASPSASAASLPGRPGSASRRFTISCTCSLRAWPWPTMAFFICSAVYSATSMVARHQRRQRRAARLAEQQRALRVDVDEHDLDRRAVRLVARGDLAHAVEDDLQAQRQAPLSTASVLIVPLAT